MPVSENLPSSLLNLPVTSPRKVVVPVYELPSPVTCVEGIEITEERSDPSNWVCVAPVSWTSKCTPGARVSSSSVDERSSVICILFPSFSSTNSIGTVFKETDPEMSS